MISRVLFSILMAGQLLVAGLIIGLVATKLNTVHVGFDAAALKASITDTCLLGAAPNGVNLCYVAYGFSGVSILASGALSLLMCCTCNLCGLGFLLDTLFALAGAAWWALAGVVLRFYTSQPPNSELPQADTRKWIVLLCWVGCGAFAAMFLLNLYRILSRCCACCHGSGGGTSRRDIEGGRGGGGGGWHAAAAPAPQAAWAPAGSPPPGYPPVRKGGKQSQFIAHDVGSVPAYWGRR